MEAANRNNEGAIKPPLGVLGRHYHDFIIREDIRINGGMSSTVLRRNRINELKGAMSRYIAAEKDFPVEWVMEYNEIIKKG